MSAIAFVMKAAAKIPMPLMNTNDPFLWKITSVAAQSSEKLLARSLNADMPPYLDILYSPQLMSSSVQVITNMDTLVGLLSKHTGNVLFKNQTVAGRTMKKKLVQGFVLPHKRTSAEAAKACIRADPNHNNFMDQSDEEVKLRWQVNGILVWSHGGRE